MKILLGILLLSSFIFAQKSSLQDYTKTPMPLFFEDSLRFNFNEVANFKASLGSYGNKSQVGVKSQFALESNDSANYQTLNAPSFHVLYNNFNGTFFLLGNEHTIDKIKHNDTTSTKAKVDKVFLQLIKGNSHNKFSIGFDGEYGKITTYHDSSQTKNTLMSVNANIGTILKIGWNSEFLLEFDFNFYKDSIRLNDYLPNEDTHLENYTPNVNLGFLRHDEQHRELVFFSYQTEKRFINSQNITDNTLLFPYEKNDRYNFGFVGNFSFAKTPVALSYSIKADFFLKNVYKNSEITNEWAHSYLKSYPLSISAKYKFSMMDLALAFDCNKINFDVYSDPSILTYYSNLKAVDDYEYSLSAFLKLNTIKNTNESFAFDFLFGLAGGYTILDNSADGFLKFASFGNNSLKSKALSEKTINTKSPYASIFTGIKATIINDIVIDIGSETNFVKKEINSSSQQVISNNLLLKVYYLF